MQIKCVLAWSSPKDLRPQLPQYSETVRTKESAYSFHPSPDHFLGPSSTIGQSRTKEVKVNSGANPHAKTLTGFVVRTDTSP